MMVIEAKKCRFCGIEKEITSKNWYFQKKKNGTIYCPTRCKLCDIIAQQERYFAKHEESKKYQVEWNRKNKEKRAKVNYNFYRDNLDKRKNYQIEYHQTERYKTNNRNLYAPKRNRKSHDVTIVEWDSCRLYFNYCCAYCGYTYESHIKKYRQDLHREHLISEGRNDLKNCIPSCRVCNSEKSEMTLNQWYNIDNVKYSRERYLKIYNWIRYDVSKYIQKKKVKNKKQAA